MSPDAECFPSDTGWMTGPLFLQWLKFFVQHVRPTLTNKALLILDNHESHRCFPCLEYASENNVVLLSMPPHCTHKLQPCDVSIYGPFKTRFETETAIWQKRNPGRVVTFYDIGEIFGGVLGCYDCYERS